MWIRMNETGAAEFVADLTRVFDLIDAGQADAIDVLPERPEPIEQPVKPDPVETRPAKKAKRG